MPRSLGARRRARAYALQILFSLDVDEPPPVADAIAGFWRTFKPREDEPDGERGLEPDANEHRGWEPEPATREFAETLVVVTTRARSRIDEVIADASKNWRIERMSRVDRNILRLATAELLTGSGIPIRIALNEAVELAKRFGAEESAAFVNGVLDRVAQEHAPGFTAERKE